MKYAVFFILAVIGAGLASPRAHAFDYHELEVYGYQTAGYHELELENTTSFSDTDNGTLRSTFETTFGVLDWLELAAYVDLGQLLSASTLAYDGVRFHARAHFFEKGELPVDLGAEIEMALPKHDSALLEAEFRGIIERDFGRWTLALNPIIERPLVTTGEVPIFELKYGASITYRLNEIAKPHLDFFGDLNGD
ncbi:MAG: hypothetical protein ACXWP5_15410, partial [Bdellovibrionota bacterium]